MNPDTTVARAASALDLRIVTPAGLVAEGTIDPASPMLERYFADYDKSFVLESEKEDIDGFRECLALNRGPEGESLRRRYAPFVEIVALVAEPESSGGNVVGGINFICFEFEIRSGKRVRTVAFNYGHLLPVSRGRGWSRELVAAISLLATRALDQLTGRVAGGDEAPLIFIEQNDPLALSDHDYALDSAHAGIDQLDRLRVWAKAGARIIDFDYAQPALTDDASEADNLVLSVAGTQLAWLDAELLLEHLRRFFAISCLKGRPLNSDPIAHTQIVELERQVSEASHIALLDPLPWLEQGDARGASQGYRKLVMALKAG